MLRNALQALQMVEARSDAARSSMSPIRHVDSLIGPCALAHLHAASPKAARAAIALVEHYARRKGPHIVNRVNGEHDPVNSSRLILSDAVSIFVHNTRVVVHVQRSATESSVDTSDCHVVLLRDLTYSHDKILLSPLSNSLSHGQSEACCDCSAFAFQSNDEPLCKHIIVAAIAVTLQLAPIEHVTENDFLIKIGGVA